MCGPAEVVPSFCRVVPSGSMPSAASIGLGPQDAHRRRFLHEAWTGCGCKEAAAAEEALLARFVKSPYSLSRVPIDLPGLGLGRQYIATLEINPDAVGPAIVWAHGAGAGLGFGYLNYDALAQLGGLRRRVLAFDWLGQANSSRPRYPHSGWGRAQPDHLSAALAFFVESLEAWRAALGVEEMDLFGHSTGAYVCAHYALAHPHRVRHLVLHGPAGIGAHPQPKVPGQPRRLAGVLPALLGALWWGGHLNFGAIQKLGWVAREPGRRRFHRFQRSRRGNVEDEGELDLLFDYFWTSLCSQPASSDSWVNSFLVSGCTSGSGYSGRPPSFGPQASSDSFPSPCPGLQGGPHRRRLRALRSLRSPPLGRRIPRAAGDSASDPASIWGSRLGLDSLSRPSGR